MYLQDFKCKCSMTRPLDGASDQQYYGRDEKLNLQDGKMDIYRQ